MRGVPIVWSIFFSHDPNHVKSWEPNGRVLDMSLTELFRQLPHHDAMSELHLRLMRWPKWTSLLRVPPCRHDADRWRFFQLVLQKETRNMLSQSTSLTAEVEIVVNENRSTLHLSDGTTTNQESTVNSSPRSLSGRRYPQHHLFCSPTCSILRRCIPAPLAQMVTPSSTGHCHDSVSIWNACWEADAEVLMDSTCTSPIINSKPSITFSYRVILARFPSLVVRVWQPNSGLRKMRLAAIEDEILPISPSDTVLWRFHLAGPDVDVTQLVNMGQQDEYTTMVQYFDRVMRWAIPRSWTNTAIRFQITIEPHTENFD
jgi:hypothetical protein